MVQEQALEIKDLRLSYGKNEVLKGVSLEILKGEMVTLLGPSGCGKTTMLRSVAGLEIPSSGEIVIEGKTVYSSEKKVNTPTETRGLSMVFQSYAIWPHMTVFENVAYGLKIKGYKGEVIKEMVFGALKMVHLDHLADRPAPLLSGGQQQRVALARSIAYRPNIMLFDEPLSNLDAKLRQEMREEIRDLQQELGFAGVFVTHDQEEALAISDRIVAMNNGIIEQSDDPQTIFEKPKTMFVAGFMGSSILLKGKVTGKQGDYLVFVTQDNHRIICSNINGLSPEEINWVAIKTCYIDTHQEQGDYINTWEGKIEGRTFFGEHYNLRIRWGENLFHISQPVKQDYGNKTQIYLSADPERCIPVKG